ncbi:MAG TPA: hypothetical protein VMS31_06825, partial [Pyrinomonadaceae bacterium]|nr:hypothetical protein [Pyrinomonadaceae bacterium]
LYPLFCFLVWQFLMKGRKRSAIFAGMVFALLVFSYFYLWTAAAAWLAILCVLWFIARAEDRTKVLRLMVVIGAAGAAALLPYLILISNSADAMGNVQALVLSRRPDLFSITELIGAVVLIVLAVGALRGSVDTRDPRAILAASFALVPFIVLNQQIITGRVMQPIHYEGFIANYSVLIAIVITGAIEWRKRSGERWHLSRRTLVWVAIATLEWGFIETYQAANKSANANLMAAADSAVYLRLNGQVKNSGPSAGESVVLFSDPRAADGAPAVSLAGVLWAPHMLVYTSTTATEGKERLYRQLYYTGFGIKELNAYFYGSEVYYGYAAGMFGFDRTIDGLNSNAKPITKQDLDDEVTSYTKYVQDFNWERAVNPRLSHVVISIGEEWRLANLDRWYRRDAGERIGKFMIYRVELRDELEAAVQSSWRSATTGTDVLR